jgi:hypothetical protein
LPGNDHVAAVGEASVHGHLSELLLLLLALVLSSLRLLL